MTSEGYIIKINSLRNEVAFCRRLILQGWSLKSCFLRSDVVKSEGYTLSLMKC